jgi:hypothetical protein
MSQTHRLAVIVLALGLAAPAQAEGVKAFGFNMARGDSGVEGAYVVDGYSIAEMQSLMARYCAGSVGEIVPQGKARKSRGLLVQKFRSTCSGGLSSAIGGNRASIEVEFASSGEYRGQHVAEITTSDGSGNIVYNRELVTP